MLIPRRASRIYRAPKALRAESPAQQERRLDRAQALAMTETIGTVLDTATTQERRAVVQQLFDRVWLERGKLTAVRPTGTYLALCGGGGKWVLLATSTGLKPMPPTSRLPRVPPHWNAFQVLRSR